MDGCIFYLGSTVVRGLEHGANVWIRMDFIPFYPSDRSNVLCVVVIGKWLVGNSRLNRLSKPFTQKLSNDVLRFHDSNALIRFSLTPRRSR